MRNYVALIALSAVGGLCAHGDEASKVMGPAAFLWPPDRLWGAAYDNNAPCGSSTGAVNRTNFPLSKRIFIPQPKKRRYADMTLQSMASSHLYFKTSLGMCRLQSHTKAVS